MSEGFANTVLQSLINHGMLATKFNTRTQEQVFYITEFGKEVHQVLEFFVEKKDE